MTSAENGRRGDVIERWAADRFGADLVREEWCDLRAASGAAIQVKAAERGRRFMVYKGPHRSLRCSDAAGVAWYLFVVTAPGSNRVIAWNRRKPATVGAVVNERLGGWNDSPHASYEKQQKIPVRYVVDGL